MGWRMTPPAKFLRRAALAAAAALAFAVPALAQARDEPMTFESGEVFGMHRVIFAKGDLTPETPEAFRAFLARNDPPPATRVLFDSNGGDLQAGMEVGRLIRGARLNTGVGRRFPPLSGEAASATAGPAPGRCLSACTLAFLGGVSRQIEPTSVYAVHQVSMECVDRSQAQQQFPWLPVPGVAYCPDLNDALSLVQTASGAVVQYVRSMGADPLFLAEMSRASPQSLNQLSAEQLAAYKITYEPQSTSWTYEADESGDFFLRLKQQDAQSEHLVDFVCQRASAPGLLMWVLQEPDAAGSAGLAETLKEGLKLSLDVGDEHAAPVVAQVALGEAGETAPPDSGSQGFGLRLDKAMFEQLTAASTARVFIDRNDPSPDFTVVSFTPDRAKLLGIWRACVKDYARSRAPT